VLPVGFPHSSQGLGPDGAEFILAFDNGEQSEFNTLLVTDWIAHTPPDVLAANFGVPTETFSKISSMTFGYIKALFPARSRRIKMRSRTRAARRRTFHLLPGGRPCRQAGQGRHGSDRRQPQFKASTTIAAALVTVHSGGTPPAMVAAHFNLSLQDIAKFRTHSGFDADLTRSKSPCSDRVRSTRTVAGPRGPAFVAAGEPWTWARPIANKSRSCPKLRFRSFRLVREIMRW